MTNVEIDNFLTSPEATDLGMNSYVIQYEATSHIKRTDWLAFGGESGESVTLVKIPLFLRQERIRLCKDYQQCLQNPETSDEFLTKLTVDLTFLRGAERLDTPFGRAVAKRYFLKQLAYEWYQFRYDPLLAMMSHQDPDRDPVSLSEYSIKCCRSALQLL